MAASAGLARPREVCSFFIAVSITLIVLATWLLPLTDQASEQPCGIALNCKHHSPCHDQQNHNERIGHGTTPGHRLVPTQKDHVDEAEHRKTGDLARLARLAGHR